MGLETTRSAGIQDARAPRAQIAGPRVITAGDTLGSIVVDAKRHGKLIGLVPTMGALHEGHLSLVSAARSECDLTVVSIFVNPTQFAANEDFARYPRDLERDIALLGDRGCDIVFAPDVDEIYGPRHATFVDVEELGAVLEGEYRPGHFRGVATVVVKLFHLARADRAYFGQKDYQQTLVIRQMVADLNLPVEVRVCPTVREADGLAMSSRNAYLKPDERRRAASLCRALRLAQQMADDKKRDVATIRAAMLREIERGGGIEVQYIAFVADGSVIPVESISGPTTVAIAAFVGDTRLIDNVLLNP